MSLEKIDERKLRSETTEHTCQTCGSELKPGSKFCLGCGAAVASGSARQESTIAGRPVSARTSKTTRIVIVLILVLAVVGAIAAPWFSSVFRQTPATLTSPSETSTISPEERLLAQISSPLNFDWKGTKMEITRTSTFRPSGESVRVVVRVVPTLKNRDYSMLFKYRLHLVSADEVLLDRESADDLWGFDKGAYAREFHLDLEAKKTVDCYLLFFPDDITFFGLQKAEQVASFQILVYDSYP